ncbi:MAG: glycosyltransferase involved in cell wall biosynthesis [Gammaproteobacteria bacterium]|jgi:glycosyltransferase involved in cell wall biosynthesis
MRVMWKPESEGSRFRRIAETDIVTATQLDELHIETVIDCGEHRLRSIKIYPDYDKSAFQILSIKLESSSHGEINSLVDIGRTVGELGKLALQKIKPVDVNNSVFLLAESADASLEVQVPSHVLAAKKSAYEYRLRVRLLFPDETYLASFRKYFLEEMSKNERKLKESTIKLADLVSETQRLANIEKELKLIKSSKVWRGAEFLREKFYAKWLAKFPELQSQLLSRARQSARENFADQSEVLGNLRSNKVSTNDRADSYDALREYWEAQRPDTVAISDRIASFGVRPLISVIVPVYNPQLDWLEDCIGSVMEQSYSNWELCICDDASSDSVITAHLDGLNHPKVKMARARSNQGISSASNAALSLATGDYVAFLDHDDLLDVDALFHVCETINDYAPDCLYSDEDYIDGQGRYLHPNFKPDFSPDTLLSHNYITHLLVVKSELLERVGVLNSEFDGAQDYDLVLRLSEQAETIMHIPKVLYHWRQSERSSSFEVSAKPYIQNRTREMLQKTMHRRGESAEILNANIPHFFYTRRKLAASPKVSIIIPFRDEPELLRGCIQSVLSNTSYRHYEILGINNQSTSPLTYSVMQEFSEANAHVRFVDYDEPFNFSALVNFGAASCKGEYLVLMNNDIEIITWEWIEELLCQAQTDTAGAVGGKLFYPDNTIQHAGIVVGIDDYAGHSHKRAGCNAQGFGNRLQIVQNVAAVTAAFLMVRRSIFEEVGGFNEENFPIACNDVDFCLRLLEAGYWNIFTPYAKAYHLESVSRGYEVTEAQSSRFEKEKTLFRERHTDVLEFGDPFYNPNLSLRNESFMVKTLEEFSK